MHGVDPKKCSSSQVLNHSSRNNNSNRVLSDELELSARTHKGSGQETTSSSHLFELNSNIRKIFRIRKVHALSSSFKSLSVNYKDVKAISLQNTDSSNPSNKSQTNLYLQPSSPDYGLGSKKFACLLWPVAAAELLKYVLYARFAFHSILRKDTYLPADST